jgi:hypothetical protein
VDQTEVERMRAANSGWEIWAMLVTDISGRHVEWCAVPPHDLMDAYLQCAGERNSAHWPVWGDTLPAGHLIGFASAGELQEA